MPKYDFSAFDKAAPAAPSKYDFSSFDSHGKSPELDPTSVSYLESLLRGSAQGATLGFADEIAGGGEALADAATNEGLQNLDLSKLMENYTKHRDESRTAFESAEQANPMTSFAGQIAGGVLPALAAPASAGLSGMLKVGAGMGAITGAGTSKADLTQGDVGGFAKDVGTSAAAGGVLNASLGSLLSKLSPTALAKTASERAVKATGANKSQIKNLLKSDRLEQHGNNLIGVNPFQDNAIVTAGATAEDVLERSQDLMQKSGEEIGNILNKLDSQYSIENPEIRKSFFNPEDAITKIKELQSKYVKNGEVVPLYKDQYRKLQDAIDTVASYGNKPINFSEAGVLKTLISDTAYSEDGKLTDQLMGQVRGIINDGIEDAADAVTQSVKNPELYQQYLQAKDFYRTSKDASNSALGKTASELVNRDLGITDYMAGIGGLMAHGGPGGVAAAGIHKVVKTYGNSVAARVAYNGANVGKALSKVPKDLLKSSGESLIASGGQLEGRLGRVLIEASDRDDVGRNAVIFSLSQNPAYRELLNSFVFSDEAK